MQNLCMLEVARTWDCLVQYLYFVKWGMENQRNKVIKVTGVAIIGHCHSFLVPNTLFPQLHLGK